jgi:hypothetical protein
MTAGGECQAEWLKKEKTCLKGRFLESCEQHLAILFKNHRPIHLRCYQCPG